MKYRHLFYWLVITGSLLVPFILHCQVTESAPRTTTTTPQDTMTTIEILPGVRKLEFRKIDDSTQLQILAGNVKLKQGNALIDCDSCVINNHLNIFEAWGHVHINDADTANVYSQHLLYLIQKKVAYLDGGVTLTDGRSTLTTPDLEYDMDTQIGIYKNGGKVLNKKSVLTSKEGYYYSGLKDIYFKRNVELKDPAYFIKTDSLLYNTETGTTRFISETFIRDSSGRTVNTKEGFYNLQTGKAEFSQRPTIVDGKMVITATRVASDDSTGISQAVGNAIIVDSTNQTTIIAGLIFRNKKTEAILATIRPLMIVKQESDSIFITADTLYSARLTDLPVKKDTLVIDTTQLQINKIQPADSLHRDSSINQLPDSLKKLISDSTARLDTSKLFTDVNEGQSYKVSKLRSDSISKADGFSSRNDSIRLTNKPDTLKADTSFMVNRPASRDTTIRKDSIGSLEILPSITDSVNLVSSKKGLVIDTIKTHDSTNRYFVAYRHVRIFSDSMQAVCDSLFYSFKDSIFHLFQDPVIWSNKSQVTGDTVLLFTKNKKADRFKVFNNSFLVNRVDPEVYNQVKSSRMDGFFTKGEIDSVRASGLAECIYYIQDNDSAYTGINQSQSDIIDAYFLNKELQKVVFRSAVSGTIWPIRQKNRKEMRLTGFRWLEERRPKSKFELLE